MKRPWLSVVMPTYNGERYVAEALGSIEREGADDLEVIVVDDGSTDGTVEIVEAFEHRLPLTLVRQEHAGNWTASTNRGMALAQGEFIGWLHQDDVWLPGRLPRMRALIAEQPEAAWYFHASRFLGADGAPVGTWRCPFPRAARCLSTVEVWERLLVQCFVATCAPIFPSRLLREVGPLDEAMWYSADWDFWLRLSRLGVGIYDSTPWSGFRIHPESQTTTRLNNLADFQIQQSTVLNRHWPEWEASGGEARVREFAELSIEMNVALAAVSQGQSAEWRRVLAKAWRVGPIRWTQFLRHSRLIERAFSRWRVGSQVERPKPSERARQIERAESASHTTVETMSVPHVAMVLPSSR